MSLVKGQSYHLRVDSIVVPPSIKAYDNTLFDKASDIRIGLLPIYGEKAMLRNAIQVAKKADLPIRIPTPLAPDCEQILLSDSQRPSRNASVQAKANILQEYSTLPIILAPTAIAMTQA
ncbi:hypothetical protein CGCSCA1_v010994 [Colletotrichum siamense]|nr:hypothetical protein CGCSCA1_v010994 [Colletotrichum siamense]